jgi:putative DNA primase/helicase
LIDEEHDPAAQSAPESEDVPTISTVEGILTVVRQAGDSAMDPKAARTARQSRAARPDIVGAIAAFLPGSPERQQLGLELRELGVSSKALEASLTWFKRQRAASSEGWRKRIWRNDRGDPEPITANAITILRNDPAWASVLAWDDFAQGVVFRQPAPWFEDDCPAADEGVLDDYTLPAMTAWLARAHRLKIGDEATYKAARTVARGTGRRYDSLCEWLRGLRYVPSSRGSLVGGPEAGPSWLTRYLGVPDSPYVRLVGRAWMISAVARGLRPGYQVDHVLIAEGAQGEGKTTAFRILVGERFSDSPLPMHDKDRFVNLRAVHVQSFDELAGLGRADQNAVKNYLTQTVDIFRPPYGRDPVKVPRRTVFCGTVNPPPGVGYLKDITGGRRFWPVRCGVAKPMDLVALEQDREQLWAEALALFESGVACYPVTPAEKALCRGEQDERQERDVWETRVKDYLDSSGRFARDEGGQDQWETSRPKQPLQHAGVDGILHEALAVPPRDQSQVHQNRIASIMASLGWSHERRTIEGIRAWRYHRPPPATLEAKLLQFEREAERLRVEATRLDEARARLALELEQARAAAAAEGLP